LLYLPIDQLLNQGTRAVQSTDGTRASDSPNPAQSKSDVRSEPADLRDRRVRQ
jgi:hypothetical protein